MSGLLLDSQVLLWFAGDESRLSKKALAALLDGKNELWLSIASIWELSIKLSIEKLRLKEDLETLIEKQISNNRLQILTISLAHTYAVQKMPFNHRDPFDRILVVQAQIENLKLVSSDEVFDAYGIKRIW